MSTQEGKFLLFLDLSDLAAWLNSSSFGRVIRLLQCHHTFIPSYDDFRQTNHFELLRGMENAHLQRGFSEIAQNLTTFPDGSVAVCRPIDTIPAGIKGANKNGICIENLGNFDVGRDSITATQKSCIVNLFAILCKKFALHPDSQSIVFHHWYDLNTGERTNGTGATKSCPGTNFFGGNAVEDEEHNLIPLVAGQLAAYFGSAPAIQSLPLYTADVQVDTLNARALPSAAAAIVKQLNRGVELPVYEERDGWCRIDAANSLWVKEEYLASNSPTGRVQALYVAQVTADLLNVRALPSLSGSVTTQLRRGQNVMVYEEHDGWSRIGSTTSEWVSNSYLGRMYRALPLS